MFLIQYIGYTGDNYSESTGRSYGQKEPKPSVKPSLLIGTYIFVMRQHGCFSLAVVSRQAKKMIISVLSRRGVGPTGRRLCLCGEIQLS